METWYKQIEINQDAYAVLGSINLLSKRPEKNTSRTENRKPQLC